MPARRLVAAASAVVAVASLSGCGLIEEPSPFVTLYADGTSVKSEASVYCFAEDARLPEDLSGELPEGCVRAEDQEPTTIEVEAGGKLAIDVDESLLESGWTLSGSQQVVEAYYRSLPVPEDFAQPVQFQVIQLVDSEIGERRGVWNFELRPKS